MQGRCLPYGEGITYWPVVEVLEQLDVLPCRRRRGHGDPLAARRDGDGDARRTRSPGPSARRSSRPRRSGRSSSSSTTSTGARRRSSTWSSTSRSCRRARRSCCSAWRARSCSSAAPPGRSRFGSSRSATTDVEAADPGQDLPGRCARGSRGAAGGNPLFVQEMLAIAGRRRRARSSFRRRCRRCSRRASISSTPGERERARAAVRSRARSSIAAPCRRSHPTRPR